ncbi:LOW QUALITY PROTEIN: hypothetical protein ACHAW6_001011 [Cyclotella cf. meneghiniana]
MRTISLQAVSDVSKCQFHDIDNHHKFIIICTNFKVTRAPVNPFEDEVAPIHAPDADTDIDHASCVNNVNILALNCAATADDIAELHAQGIEVDNKDPAPENTVAGTTAPTGTWEELRTCPQRGDPDVTNTKGFVAKPWTAVGEMNELALFCMCFPESFLRKTIIPAISNHFQGLQ